MPYDREPFSHRALALSLPLPLLAQGERAAYRPDVPGTQGLVTAGHPLAATAGLRMLLLGGNAIDAAVATLATLNVVRPQMSGAGGNGFFTIYDSATHEVYSLNATGAAPMALDASLREPDELAKGIYAGVVPGLFGGWVEALDRFGTMSLDEVLAPAIEYAENGHPVEASVVNAIERGLEVFRKFPTSSAMFLQNGNPPAPNTLVRRLDLARTFRKVAEAEQRALRGESRSEALRAAFDRFYIVDRFGNAVACTPTHGSAFGTGVSWGGRDSHSITEPVSDRQRLIPNT